VDGIAAAQAGTTALLLADNPPASEAIVDQLVLGRLAVAVPAALQQYGVALNPAIAGIEIHILPRLTLGPLAGI